MPGKCSITEPYIHLKRIFYLIFLKKEQRCFQHSFHGYFKLTGKFKQKGQKHSVDPSSLHSSKC